MVARTTYPDHRALTFLSHSTPTSNLTEVHNQISQ
jgi:hypothetical protein